MPTRALGRAVLLTGLLLLAAVLLGRVDLVVIAAPFALGTALALRRPADRPAPGCGWPARRESPWRVPRSAPRPRSSNQDVVGYDLVVARVRRADLAAGAAAVRGRTR